MGPWVGPCRWLPYRTQADLDEAAKNNPPGILRTHWHMPGCYGGALDCTDRDACTCSRPQTAQREYQRMCDLADEQLEAHAAQLKAEADELARIHIEHGQAHWRQHQARKCREQTDDPVE